MALKKGAGIQVRSVQLVALSARIDSIGVLHGFAQPHVMVDPGTPVKYVLESHGIIVVVLYRGYDYSIGSLNMAFESALRLGNSVFLFPVDAIDGHFKIIKINEIYFYLFNLSGCESSECLLMEFLLLLAPKVNILFMYFSVSIDINTRVTFGLCQMFGLEGIIHI